MSTPVGDWEPVFTVQDYYDGPRNGVANYAGRPHAFLCEWDDEADAWSEAYVLSPISEEQLRLVQEDWGIWRRYASARHAGRLGPDDEHPSLAADRSRHKELEPLMKEALRLDLNRAVSAVPEFRGTLEAVHAFEVRWVTA